MLWCAPARTCAGVRGRVVFQKVSNGLCRSKTGRPTEGFKGAAAGNVVEGEIWQDFNHMPAAVRAGRRDEARAAGRLSKDLHSCDGGTGLSFGRDHGLEEHLHWLGKARW
jgi:hypothetical protein